MNRYIIDRIESDFIICEDEVGNMINLKKDLVKGILREGSVILKRDNKYNISETETNKRKKEIENLMEGMWKNE